MVINGLKKLCMLLEDYYLIQKLLTAITCPTVNSYNGLVPTVGGFEGGVHTWAPTNITYGHNNRSAQFRLPQNRYCIENRAADLTMNVYLALGMTIISCS